MRRREAPEAAPAWLWLIVAVAVAARVGAAVFMGDDIRDMPGVADERSYHELAERVRGGYGFTFGTGWWPATPAGEPTAHWSYLYVLLVAGAYQVLGAAHPLAIRVLQAGVVGVVQPYLTWRIGRRMFGDRAGLAAASAAALYGYFVYYAAALMTEAFYIAAVLWVVDLALRIGAPSPVHMARADRLAWGQLGVAMGAATLLRQAFLPCVPVVVGWIVWQRVRAAEKPSAGVPAWRAPLAGASLAVGLMGLLIVPWTVRNYQAFGAFIPLNTNAGFAFFWGNHPVHGFTFKPLLEGNAYGSLIPDELRSLDEAALDRALLVRGLQFVWDEPGRYLSLCLGRTAEFLKFWPTRESAAASNAVRVLSFGVAWPLMALGLSLGLRSSPVRQPGGGEADGSPAARFVVLLALVHSAVYLLTWTLVRYRLPVDAVLMPFVGLGLVAVADRLGVTHLLPRQAARVA